MQDRKVKVLLRIDIIGIKENDIYILETALIYKKLLDKFYFFRDSLILAIYCSCKSVKNCACVILKSIKTIRK